LGTIRFERFLHKNMLSVLERFLGQGEVLGNRDNRNRVDTTIVQDVVGSSFWSPKELGPFAEAQATDPGECQI
jgi:hypothetical protein